MMRVLAPTALVHGKIATDEGDGQTDYTRNLEPDVAAHCHPGIRAMDQEPGAYDSCGGEDEKCKCCE